MSNFPHEDAGWLEKIWQAANLPSKFTAVHVGCLDGYELNNLKKNFPDCRVVGIDPMPVSPLMISEIHYLAIGNTNGMATFSDPGVGLSSLYPRGGGQLQVKVQLLDDFLCEKAIDDVKVLIIDTEGTTMDVLRGASKTLANVKLLITEVQLTKLYEGGSLAPEITTYLEQYNLQRRPELGYDAGPQANYVYIKEDA